MARMHGDYILQLGTNRPLSKAEFARYFKDHDYGFNARAEFGEFVHIRADAEASPATIMKKLGGIVRIISLMDRRTIDPDKKALHEGLSSILDTYDGYEPKKIGLSIFRFDQRSRDLRGRLLARTVKPWLKQQRLKTKIIQPTSKKGYSLSPMQVSRKKLIRDGVELVQIRMGNDVVSGVTEAISDPRSAVKRDTHRQFSMVTHGSSVRLARILVNLADIQKGMTVLDPFCGTGTILQEALLNDADVVGMDTDLACVRGTRENLESASKIFSIIGEWKVIAGNAKAILDHIEPDSLDAIVTEPYLGPFLRRPPTKHEVNVIMDDLLKLYKSFLRGASRALKPGGRVVFITPRFHTTHGEEAAFSMSTLLKRTDLAMMPPVKDNFDPMQPISYGREENKIGRDIWILHRRFKLKLKT